MTLKTYKWIDLLMLCIVFLVIETMIWRFGFINVHFWVSISIPLIIASIIRWRKSGLVVVGVTSIAHVIYQYLDGNSPYILMISFVSMLSVGFVILIRPYLMKHLDHFSKLALGYVFIYFIYLLIIWTMTSLIIRYASPLDYIIYHSLNLIIGLLLIGLMSKQKTFLVDMELHLKKKE